MKICREVTAVTQKENYVSVQTNAVEIRIWFLTDDIVRLRAGFTGEWDEASYSLVLTAWDSRTDDLFKNERKKVKVAESLLTDGADTAVIRGKKLTVEIQKKPFLIRILDAAGNVLHEDIPDLACREDGNSRRFHTSWLGDDDCYYGFGEKSGEINKAQKMMNMAPGDSMGYNPKETDSLYKHIPFYIRLAAATKQATGYFYHNTAECYFNMGRERRNYWHHYSTYCTDAGDIDLFFIAGPSIREVVSRYTDLTGKSMLLPKGGLGYLGSSMYYSELPKDADDAITEFVDTAKQEDIPIDGFQLSSGYCAIETKEGVKRCCFTWNHERFKDPAAWFAGMKERGVLVSPNIKPGMLLVHPLLKEMEAKDMMVKASDSEEPGVGTWWGGPGEFVDFTKESSRENWKRYIRDSLLQYGCRSIWNDNCEYDSMVDKDCRVSFEGKGATIGELKPVMSNLMCRLSDEAIEEYTDGKERPFSVCRSGHAGIQRYAQVWAGDNFTSWDTLKYNIATILGMGLSGVANHGCDVGGFYGPAPDEELFVRWVQMGAFMPRFSIHSTNTDNTVTEPWMYSGSKDLIRKAIHFRYQMSPYLYSLENRAHETGLPIMEPLFLAFQNDPKTWNEGETFLWGDGLLAAPVVDPGAVSKSVYLPEGSMYYDFYTRRPYEGGQTIEVPVDLSSVPLFLTSGAIVPFAVSPVRSLAKDPVKDLGILIVPDRDSSFVLYDDDGVTNAYRDGVYRRTEIRVQSGARTYIRFASTGSYPSAANTIRLDVVHREKGPFFVQLDGREIPHFLYRPKFEAAEEGWYYSQTKKSVEVKYRNPKKDHEVLISFEQFDLLGM
jgi:alpha-glucosidase